MVPSPKYQVLDTGRGTEVLVKWMLWFEHVASELLNDEDGMAITSCMEAVSEQPAEDCTVNTTLYVPELAYLCIGDGTEPKLPSPKSQL